jgi:ribosomal RNA-processing protein 1
MFVLSIPFRMDKYYMLIRKYIYASFVLLINLDWKREACKRYIDILLERGGPMHVFDSPFPFGPN